jgi:hypothetical protein
MMVVTPKGGIVAGRPRTLVDIGNAAPTCMVGLESPASTPDVIVLELTTSHPSLLPNRPFLFAITRLATWMADVSIPRASRISAATTASRPAPRSPRFVPFCAALPAFHGSEPIPDADVLASSVPPPDLLVAAIVGKTGLFFCWS